MQNQEQKVSSFEQSDATKLKKRRNPIKFVVFSFLLVIILLPVAVGLAQAYLEQYRLNSGASKNTSDSVAVATLNAACKTIVNNSGVDYFVPAKSASEYNSFIAAAPRLGVAISPCSNCGDGECGYDINNNLEDALNCPEDCTYCGDAHCTGAETCDSCAGDCGECCGNGYCDYGETCSTCYTDCGTCACGDPSDCPSGYYCYDYTAYCDGPENHSCYGFTKSICSDGCSWNVDSWGYCVSGSCTPSCGSKDCGSDGCGGSCGSCTYNEICVMPGDCISLCGNGTCAGAEDCSSCPGDCGTCNCSDNSDCTSGQYCSGANAYCTGPENHGCLDGYEKIDCLSIGCEWYVDAMGACTW
jgi:hypothetical protein